MRCNPQLLWTLVHQQADPPPQSKKLFSHLESCARCRETLLQLSGGKPWEEQATRLLDDWRLPELDEAEEAADDLLPLPDLRFLDPPAHPELLGRIGRYDVESVLGRGGMGIVLRGFDAELQRTVAIKVLAPEWAASDAAKRRFAREAQAAASVAHENVVPIYNVGADANPPYIVMRYIPGVTLQQWVDSQGPLPPPVILRITSQLAAGLSAAHARGLVHRDVKPANVLVGENTDRVWLSDFGLARAADEARFTRTGTIAGTPHYMSPEQARGEPLDGRSDWFSLGCLIYFMSTGVPPFDAPSTLAILQQTITAKPKPLHKLRPDLPEALIDLVNRMLMKRPERRSSDQSHVDAALKLADSQIAGNARAKRFVRRWCRTITLSAFAFCLLLAVGWITANWPRFPAQTPLSARNNSAISQAADPWILAENEADRVGSRAEVLERPGSSPPEEISPAQLTLQQSLDELANWQHDQFETTIAEIQRSLESLENTSPTIHFFSSP